MLPPTTVKIVRARLNPRNRSRSVIRTSCDPVHRNRFDSAVSCILPSENILRMGWAGELKCLGAALAGAVSLMLKGASHGKRPLRSRCSSLPCCRRDASSTSRAHRLLSPTHSVGLVAIAIVLTTAEWWRFALYDNASRFLRSAIAVAIVMLAAAAYRLLSAVRHRRTAVHR